MKCANCSNDAVYIYRITKDVFTPYCYVDLPSFLNDRRKAGLLETTQDHKDKVAEGLKNFLSVPETTTTEEVVEKPVKKAVKKKAN